MVTGGLSEPPRDCLRRGVSSEGDVWRFMLNIGLIVLLILFPGALMAERGTRDLSDFPVRPGEDDDSARIQRAVDATSSGVLRIPGGLYRISETIWITNRCSIEMHKTAVLRAVKPMDYVIHVDHTKAKKLPKGDFRCDDYNLFVVGGKVDGDGLASCLYIAGFEHFTMRDMAFLNGKEAGLRVHGGYELIANNLYFKCVKPGLAGNCALYTTGGDSHYTDCISVDYTVGFRIGKGGSNRLTRCHVWGGPLPPVRKGEPREMLKDSVNFWVDGAASVILRDCYADTGKTGYLIDGWDTRMLGCSYFNNKLFGLDGIVIIRHKAGRLLVADGAFVKNASDVKTYEGEGEVCWRDVMYSGFDSTDDCPGAVRCNGKKSISSEALKLAE